MVYLNIDVLLKQKGKTRYWLVKQLETDYRSVNKMVDNKSVALKLETIDKLVNAFNCDFNDLFRQEQ